MRHELTRAPGLLLLLSSGCAGLILTPRTVDRAAPTDAIAQVMRPSACAREVQLFRSDAEIIRPFSRVASLSATCAPNAPVACERALQERACKLEADAVVLEAARGATSWESSVEPLVSQSGRAIRFRDR